MARCIARECLTEDCDPKKHTRISKWFSNGSTFDTQECGHLHLCPRSVDKLPRGRLPQGIEIQILDLGYEENHLKNKGKHSNWFTSHGDVFPVGVGRMKAFTPEITYVAKDGTKYKVGKPNSARSFPTKRLTRPHGHWNHYYIRAINGEVRLWVNGEEVSGGYDCKPSEGHLVMESEGAPIDYRAMRLRELPRFRLFFACRR